MRWSETARYEPGPAPAPRNTVKTTWQRVAENYFQRKHLRNKHPEEWEKCNRLRSENGSSSTPAKKQTTLPESFTNCVPYDKNGARWKAITEAITFYIATDMLPIYSVEKRGFNHMLKVLDARYVVPSRKYFADVALPHLYNTDIEPDTDPLEWWKLHQPNFPRLSLLAKKYLSIPATSAPSERVFSVGGGIVTCNRACLKPEVVDRLIFLAKNV
ncbi:Zinc finger BED domain-containing protein 4 [Labeo rohita]|uniref:Zinc finger BED domain-containing protein 4 n=1 Tax=Labeo rohita TaxID=84645 RepID=A0ABQ8LFY0_LABRO|nr:Zinc finger BED domain-containing protein 4 [Labeo rohita]